MYRFRISIFRTLWDPTHPPNPKHLRETVTWILMNLLMQIWNQVKVMSLLVDFWSEGLWFRFVAKCYFLEFIKIQRKYQNTGYWIKYTFLNLMNPTRIRSSWKKLQNLTIRGFCTIRFYIESKCCCFTIFWCILIDIQQWEVYTSICIKNWDLENLNKWLRNQESTTGTCNLLDVHERNMQNMMIMTCYLVFQPV